MIIWSGKGALTFLILIVGIVISQSVYEVTSGLKPADQNADLMWASAFFIAFAGNFFLCRYLDQKPNRVVVDKVTGEELELDHKGSLFFISVKRWTTIYAVICLILWFRFIFL